MLTLHLLRSRDKQTAALPIRFLPKLAGCLGLGRGGVIFECWLSANLTAIMRSVYTVPGLSSARPKPNTVRPHFEGLCPTLSGK